MTVAEKHKLLRELATRVVEARTNLGCYEEQLAKAQYELDQARAELQNMVNALKKEATVGNNVRMRAIPVDEGKTVLVRHYEGTGEKQSGSHVSLVTMDGEELL